MSFGPYKAAEPCDSYLGNVCSGFGGSLTCIVCGWQLPEHPCEIERVKALWAGLMSDDSCAAEPPASSGIGPNTS